MAIIPQWRMFKWTCSLYRADPVLCNTLNPFGKRSRIVRPSKKKTKKNLALQYHLINFEKNTVVVLPGEVDVKNDVRRKTVNGTEKHWNSINAWEPHTSKGLNFLFLFVKLAAYSINSWCQRWWTEDWTHWRHLVSKMKKERQVVRLQEVFLRSNADTTVSVTCSLWSGLKSIYRILCSKQKEFNTSCNPETNNLSGS